MHQPNPQTPRSGTTTYVPAPATRRPRRSGEVVPIRKDSIYPEEEPQDFFPDWDARAWARWVRTVERLEELASLEREKGKQNGRLPLLSVKVAKLLARLATKAKPGKGKLTPTIDALAGMIGRKSRAATHRALKALRDAGLLDWIKRKDWKRDANGNKVLDQGHPTQQISSTYAPRQPVEPEEVLPRIKAAQGRWDGQLLDEGVERDNAERRAARLAPNPKPDPRPAPMAAPVEAAAPERVPELPAAPAPAPASDEAIAPAAPIPRLGPVEEVPEWVLALPPGPIRDSTLQARLVVIARDRCRAIVSMFSFGIQGINLGPSEYHK